VQGAKDGWSEATAKHRLTLHLTTFCSSLRSSPRSLQDTGYVSHQLLSLPPAIKAAAASPAFAPSPVSLSPSLESLANSQPETPLAMQIHIDGSDDTEDSVVQFNTGGGKISGTPRRSNDDTAKLAAQTPLYKRGTPFVNKAAMSARSKRRMSIRRRLAANSPLVKKENKVVVAESSDDDTDEMARHLERTGEIGDEAKDGRSVATTVYCIAL